MADFTEEEISRQLNGLRAQARSERRRTEKVGGLLLAVAGLAVAALFLWILKLSLKQTFDLLLATGGVVVSVALFGWGLKMAVVGRKT